MVDFCIVASILCDIIRLLIDSLIVAFVAGAFIGFIVKFFIVACIALLAFIAFMAFSEAFTFFIALPGAMLMMVSQT
jgi:hypothetical protein